MARLTP